MKYWIILFLGFCLCGCDAFDVLDERLVESFIQDRISSDTSVVATGNLSYEIDLDSSTLSNVRGFTLEDLTTISVPTYSLQVELSESAFATLYVIEVGIGSEVLYSTALSPAELASFETDLTTLLEDRLASQLEKYVEDGEVGSIFTKVIPNSLGATYTCKITHESLIYMNIRSCEEVPAGSSLDSCP